MKYNVLRPIRIADRYSSDNERAHGPDMKRTLIASVAAVLTAATALTGAADDLQKMSAEARQIALKFMQSLGGELRREMDASGPLRTILVCKFYAPEVASSLSRETGWRVSRVSLRTRNPALGYPDPWAQRVLAEFDRRAAGGENPAKIEHAEIVSEPQGKVFRYMKALPVQDVCLNCHGKTENISDAVRYQLSKDYPHDRGVGYSVGQVRGAVTVKRPCCD